VPRQIDLADPSVRRLDVTQTGVRELLDQPVLQGPKHPLAAPARLRRIGRDVLDPEPIERTADLGAAILVHRLASLVGVEVVAAAVGVERAGQPVRHNTSSKPQNVETVPSSSTRKAE